jgi:hypothetical protein
LSFSAIQSSAPKWWGDHAGLVNDPGFDDEAAELEEVPRALSALDLSYAHAMSRRSGSRRARTAALRHEGLYGASHLYSGSDYS